MSGVSRPDVVIVGAGIVGAACAFYAARAGLAVTVVDRGPVAGGSTGVGTGNILVSGKSGPLRQLAIRSHRLWEEIGTELGTGPIRLARRGSLAIATTEAELAELHRHASQHPDDGVDAVPVDPDDLHELEPRLADGLAGGVHYPADLRVHPRLATTRLLRASGARVRCGVEVRGVELGAGDRVTGVRTSQGRIPCGAVVNAAGPWAGELSGQCGRALPIRPRRGLILVTEPLAAGRQTARKARPPIRHAVYGAGYAATVASQDWQAHTAPMLECDWAGAVLIGASRELVGFSESWPLPVMRTLAAQATTLFPFLSQARVTGAYRGFRPDTPDHLPVLGADPWVGGLFHACGHEGAGVALAPVTGVMIAALLTGVPQFEPQPSPDGAPLVDSDSSIGERGLDPYPFQPERFA